MGIEPGDKLIRTDRRTRPLTVVALCEDPRRAWVIESFNHGLVDSNAYVVDLAEYQALKPAI
jgi:hypothetical protein